MINGEGIIAASSFFTSHLLDFKLYRNDVYRLRHSVSSFKEKSPIFKVKYGFYLLDSSISNKKDVHIYMSTCTIQCSP